MSFWGIIGNGLLQALLSGEDGVLTHLVNTEVTGSAVTSVSFSGLTLTNRAALVLIGRSQHTEAASHALQLNGNTTAANYYTQLVQASATTFAAFRLNDNNFYRVQAGGKIVAVSQFFLTGDRIQVLTEYTRNDDDAIFMEKTWTTLNADVTNLTSIDIVSSVASNILVGSVFDLYALGNV